MRRDQISNEDKYIFNWDLLNEKLPVDEYDEE